MCYNNQSILENREYATSIYKVKTEIVKEFSHYKIKGFGIFKYKKAVYNVKLVTYYSYLAPNTGEEGTVWSPNAPKGKKRVARAHTHGAYIEEIGKENDMFSEADIVSSYNAKVPNYLITPSGTMRKYDPKTNEDIILYYDMTYDVNDPYRYCDYKSRSYIF